MLFLSCFWSFINSRLCSTLFNLYYFPLLSCYSFSIPFSNSLLPLFSSLPIQCSQISIKIGFINYTIEGIAQTISNGILSIILQCKEFLYSYFSLSDNIIGSIYYSTTGLHGFHALSGTYLSFIIILLILLFYLFDYYFIITPFSLYFNEYFSPLFLSSYYRHFVDFIWFLVFLFYLLYYNIL